MEKGALQATKGGMRWADERGSGNMKRAWVVIFEDEGGCKWVRLVVD